MIHRFAQLSTASLIFFAAAHARGEQAVAQIQADDEAGVSAAMRLGVEADFGVAGRLGGSDSGYRVDERAGALIGGGVFFSPMPLFDVGLSYQRTQIGAEVAPPENFLAANSLYRNLNSVWVNVRTYPFRTEKADLFVGLVFGPSWESTHGHITLPPTGSAGVMHSYRCSASGPAALALGLTAGADIDLGGGLAFLMRVTGSSHNLSGELLTDSDGRICGPGAGSVATLDGRIGFAYRFDLGQGS